MGGCIMMGVMGCVRDSLRIDERAESKEVAGQ